MGNARTRRRVTAAALLIGWVVVVVVGAGRRPDDAPLLGVADLGMFLFGVLVLLALAGLVLLIFLMPKRSGEQMEVDKRSRRGIWALVALAILLTIWNPDIFGQLRELAGDPADEDAEEVDLELFDSEPAAESVAQASDILLLLIGIAVVAGIWALARNRSTELEPELSAVVVDEEFEAELLVAMTDASAELASSDDPRTNVLNAYAALEAVLASQQQQRRQAETPTEHLRRAVSSLRVDPEPLIELGGLYELARFADTDITVAQQDNARRALDRARQDLAALA